MKLYKFPTVTLTIIGINVMVGVGIAAFSLLSMGSPHGSAGACIKEEHPECIREASKEEFGDCALDQFGSDRDPTECLITFREECRYKKSVINECLPAAASISTQYGFTPGKFSFGNSYTALTAIFIHAGVWHLLINMLLLFFTGVFVEARINHTKFLLLYLLSGVGGHLLLLLFNAEALRPAIGASGAIYGILGASLILKFYNQKNPTFPKIGNQAFSGGMPTRWLFGLFMLALINSLFVTSGSVAHEAHLGGFIIGVLVMGILVDSSERYEPVPDA
jgi:membrane associated rhomboid family serine protease